MQLTRKAIFYKCWLWSVVFGIVVAALFWLVSDIGSVFHWEYGGTVFLNLLIGSSIIGGYLGAGFIGWRIADNYYHDAVAHFFRYYKHYSTGSFVLLILIMYSPLSILAFLWSVLAPTCVLVALAKAKKSEAL